MEEVDDDIGESWVDRRRRSLKDEKRKSTHNNISSYLEDLDITLIDDNEEEDTDTNRSENNSIKDDIRIKKHSRNVSEERHLKRRAQTDLVIKHLAGWSAVKMFERYVPEVVMQRIVREVVYKEQIMGKKASLQNITGSPHHLRKSSLNIRRKSLRLRASITLHEMQEKAEQRGKVTIEDNCTVVLADISGFTKLAEKLAKRPDGSGTEILSSRLNKYFGRMIDMIYAGGGDVIKFAGDALLVVWRENKNANKDINENNTSRKNNISSVMGRSKSKLNSLSRQPSRSVVDKDAEGRNPSPTRVMRRKRSSVHVTMTRRNSFASLNPLNIVREDEDGKTRKSDSNSEDWRSQMKKFRDTLDDKKMKDKTIRNRALTSMSDRISHSGSFDSQIPDYRSSSESKRSFNSSLDGFQNKITNPEVRNVGPEVTDFIAMIREELERGKLSPEQYLKVVQQRYGLYFRGELDGMGDAVSAIRREEEQGKLLRLQTKDRINSNVTSKLKELVGSMQEGIEVKNRRGDRKTFFKYYTNCFVGEDAVIWLLKEKHCGELKEALATGNMMLTTGLIVQLTGKHNNLSSFESNRNLYRFTNVGNNNNASNRILISAPSKQTLDLKRQHALVSKEIKKRSNTATVSGFLKHMGSGLRSINNSGTSKLSKGFSYKNKSKGGVNRGSANEVMKKKAGMDGKSKSDRGSANEVMKKKAGMDGKSKSETQRKAKGRTKSDSDKQISSRKKMSGPEMALLNNSTHSRHSTTMIDMATEPDADLKRINRGKFVGIKRVSSALSESAVDSLDDDDDEEEYMDGSKSNSGKCRPQSHNKEKTSNKCSDSTFAAVHTCLQMVRLLDKFEGLRLHIGVGVGKTLFMHVGGVLDRWEFVMAGEALVQMSHAEEEAEAGDLCVSGEVWERVGKYCVGHPTLQSMNRGSDLDGNMPIGDSTAVHIIVGTKALPVKYPCRRRWQTWQEERHYKIQGDRDLDLPLKLASRLLNYVPGTIRDILTKLHLEAFETSSYGGNTTVVKYDKSRLFEFRTGSVLFINLPGIDYSANKTIILETLQSSLVIMQEEIYLLEGSVRQFIMDDKGTTLIGVFGLYPAHDNDPYLAIKCALNIVKRLEEMDIHAKVGITTGTVFAAEVGNDRRCEYAVIGDIVNMSARLMVATSKINEKLYEKISILCDQATYRATASKFRFMRLKPITVKGKSEPLNVYSPLCIRSLRSYGRSSKTPFVSREKELDLLNSLVEPIVSRTSGERMVVIKGDPGVGKSRLVSEFLETCNQLLAKNIKIFRIVADKLEIQRPYGALQSFFGSIINHFNNMGFHLQSKNPQSPWDLEGDFKYLVPLILTRRECLQEIILNKDGEGKNHNLDTHGRGNKGRATLRGQLSDEEKLDFLMSLIELYVMTTSATMTFLYISHADHCDPSSINFLRRMVSDNRTNKWPLLIIATLREELAVHSDKNSSSGKHLKERGKKSSFFVDFSIKGIMRFELPLFDKAATKELIVNYLNASAPKGLTSKIYNRTGGNALYIEEVVEALVSSATLIEEDGTFKFNEVVVDESSFSVPLPDTMKSMYQEIIDRLDSDCLWILTIASVIGLGNDTFTTADIRHVYEETRKQLANPDDNNLANKIVDTKTNGLENNTVNVRDNDVIGKVLLTLIKKRLIINVTSKLERKDVSTSVYSFCRWELQEVMYGKASFTARRRIHGVVANYYRNGHSLIFTRRRGKNEYSAQRTGRRSESVVAKSSFSESKLDQYGKAHNFSIVGMHYERALSYKNAILYLSKALEIYKRLYRYVNVIETSKEILFIVSSIDYKEKAAAKIQVGEDGAIDAEAERRMLVHIRRELGEIYLKLGRVGDAYPMLNEALIMCDIDPNSLQNTGKNDATLQFEKLFKKWSQMDRETNLPEKNASFYLLFESGLTFLSLAQHYLTIDSPAIGISMVLKAIELSLIPKGASALLARSFGIASHYLHFYLRNRKLSSKYIEAAVAVSKKVYDPPATALLQRLQCELNLCNADLGNCIPITQQSATVSLGLGDTAGYMAARRLEGDSVYFSGNINAALSCFQDALSKITDVKTFEHVWNEVGRARCLFFMLEKDLDFYVSIGICSEFLGSFSSKAVKILAGSKLVSVEVLVLLQLYRSPRNIRKLSRKQIDTVLNKIVYIDSYNSGLAFCQVLEMCLGIWEAMLMTNFRRNFKHGNTTVKQKEILADMRLRFLFGVGFLVPNAEKYLCKIYPLASTETAFPDKIYIYLKRLSDATKVYPVLSSSYKRLSGVFHALSGRFGKARTKFDQAIEFANAHGLRLEATLSSYMQVRYIPSRNTAGQIASLFIKYSHEFNDLGATIYGKAAQLEAQVRHRASFFNMLLQNHATWLEFQNMSHADALTEMIREAITNRN